VKKAQKNSEGFFGKFWGKKRVKQERLTHNSKSSA
jgi:hypothetical protein